MAKSENNPESGSPETLLTKSLLVSENPTETFDVVPSESTYGSKYSCQHVTKAIDINVIRKNCTFSPLKCSHCTPSAIVSNDLSVCMKCGKFCCADHISSHFEVPRSDPHVLFTKISDWSVKCSKCDIDVPIDISGKLREAVSLLRNHQNRNKIVKPESESISRITASESSVFSRSDMMSPSTSLAFTTTSSKPSTSLMPPRGLNNLGNTCFFNSVLQNLARTPFLLDNLRELQETGEEVTLQIDNNTSMTVKLQERWGPVTEALAGTLAHITQQGSGSFSPGHLLDALRKKHMQFMGYNQHDAHELLRTLLDCVKTEDIRRYQMEILRHYGLSKKTNPEDVDERKRTLAKELNKRLTEIVNIRPDPVFRGLTVSANQCTKCNHLSEIPESFLDLSLPVSFLNLQPPSISRRKSDFGEKPKSKHQIKKERQAARKNKKLSKMKKRFEGNSHINEKNRNFESSVVEMKDVSESGYSSGKASSPIQNSDNQTSNENRDEMLAEALNEINGTSTNGTNEDTGIKLDMVISPASETFFGESAVSDIPFVTAGVAEATSGCSQSLPVLVHADVNNEHASKSDSGSQQSSIASYRLINSVNTPKSMNNLGSSGSEDDKEDNDVDDEDEDDVDDSAGSEDESVEDNVSDAFEMKARGLCATLSPPYEDEENSILACLREYTKCEILTGNNKVNCEKCTKEYQKTSGEKKQVYKTFTKQLLIKSPPPVLILHLKRFEMKGAFSFRKVEKFISFPLILDVGSFCSNTCERLLFPEQKNVIYSLYGIVEHSGSLNAGHYVAYVKVRKMADLNTYRRVFLPKNKSVASDSIREEDFNQIMDEHKNGEYQWFYISDSSVRQISQEDVLRKQAYLLFYERIW